MIPEALTDRIRQERLEDVSCWGGYLYFADRWWSIEGFEEGSSGGEVIELELAGPSEPLNVETFTLAAPGDDVCLYADELSGLQFRDGELLSTPWPDRSIIYVKDARLRGIGSDPSEVVRGIFILRYGSDGEQYYAPADSADQPGMRSSWHLYRGWDLILNWKPVDVADLLTRMEAQDA